MAGPMFTDAGALAATKLETAPVHQIRPPSTPSRCCQMVPRKYARSGIGSPSTGTFMKIALKKGVLSKTPAAKQKAAE